MSTKDCGFSKTANEDLATHPVAGVADCGDLKKYASSAAWKGSVDATVQPCHKARRVRFWGALEHMAVMRGWGLDVDEFDPEAASRGCYPDVIFCHLQPNYTFGDVEQMLDAMRHGTHFVTLQATDQWSAALAKRLGHTYGGVMNAAPQDAVWLVNCPKLFEGFPAGRPDAGSAPYFRSHTCGMYMTGERCLLGLADMKQKRICSAIAQYPYGKGAATLVGPFVTPVPKEINEPSYKRLLLNLITLLPPVCGKCGR